jgi:molybdopterin synthase sulfur carrier subunit
MITIHFFAGLKRFFSTSIQMEALKLQTAKDVIDQLKATYPEASDLLDTCRIAVNEEFVEPSIAVKPNMELFLMPPSSGG